MRFQSFFQCLRERHSTSNASFVSADLLVSIVIDHHIGIGTVSVIYFKDFPGAQMGSFLLLEEQRTSPYEEAFYDAEIFVSDRFSDDPFWRRVVAAKELMHVFDDADRRAGTPEAFIRLVQDIVNNPLAEDESEPYRADRLALWKAILSLVPPWLRDAPSAADLSSEELGELWQVPLPVVGTVKSEYYNHMLQRFQISD